MYISDDTTTQINTDQDDDKMLILSGTERLEYFSDTSSLFHSESSKQSGLFGYITKLLH